MRRENCKPIPPGDLRHLCIRDSVLKYPTARALGAAPLASSSAMEGGQGSGKTLFQLVLPMCVSSTWVIVTNLTDLRYPPIFLVCLFLLGWTLRQTLQFISPCKHTCSHADPPYHWSPGGESSFRTMQSFTHLAGSHTFACGPDLMYGHHSV